MAQIVLDAEAGQLSAELVRRGIPSHFRVHALVDVPHVSVALHDEFPMAAIAQAGKGLDWLAEEPDIYSDSDLTEVAR